MTDAFVGNFDLASLTLWLFWIFFALLIFYLLLTWVSQIAFDRLNIRVSRGMAVSR